MLECRVKKMEAERWLLDPLDYYRLDYILYKIRNPRGENFREWLVLHYPDVPYRAPPKISDMPKAQRDWIEDRKKNYSIFGNH
jgi:hypothetical protein